MTEIMNKTAQAASGAAGQPHAPVAPAKDETPRYDIRDIALAPSGHTKIEWVRNNMPLLRALEDDFRRTRPFEGQKISLSVHLEAKTAYLCLVLAAGGAQMSVTGSNSLSTQDDVAAALADSGLSVFAYHGATDEEYTRHIEMCLEHKPNIIIDDGGDLVEMLHNKRPDLASEVIGGCEETTTGVIRLKAMAKEGVLRFPMVAVNDAKCKHLFDHFYRMDEARNGEDKHYGLGLAIAKAIATGHHGKIEVRCHDGKVQFILSLPTEKQQIKN